MLTIILTRHGQTEWNRVERFRGRVEVALNDIGVAQAQATSRRIAATWQPAAVYTSPMDRAVKTGGIIAAPFGLEGQPLHELNDLNFGEWQGLTPPEVKARWPELHDTWYRRPDLVHIPSGETLYALQERVARLFNRLILRHPDATVVLVGHECTNRVILLHTLGLPLRRYWNVEQGTCAINVIQATADDFTVVSMNETYHLTVG